MASRPVAALQDEFYCHAHNRDGLVGIVFVDKEYPVRSAFCVVNKVGPPYIALCAGSTSKASTVRCSRRAGSRK